MALVAFARHLYRFFPELEGKEIQVQAGTVAEVVAALDKMHPGFGFYITDERGSLRTHVNIFIEEELVVDRARLRDRLKPDSRVYILQALSGG